MVIREYLVSLPVRPAAAAAPWLCCVDTAAGAAAAAAVAGEAAALATGSCLGGLTGDVTNSVLTWCIRDACLWYKSSHDTQNVSLQSLQNFVATDAPQTRHSKSVEPWAGELSFGESIPSSASSYSESPSLSLLRSVCCGSSLTCRTTFTFSWSRDSRKLLII